jgi:hypothetical protein
MPRGTSSLARIAIVLATISLLYTVAGPAQASSAGEPTGPAVDTSVGSDAPQADVSIQWIPAPPCVARWTGHDWWGSYVGVRNDCGYETVYVKVYIAFGPDSACFSLRPAETKKYYYPYGRFDGVGFC